MSFKKKCLSEGNEHDEKTTRRTCSLCKAISERVRRKTTAGKELTFRHNSKLRGSNILYAKSRVYVWVRAGRLAHVKSQLCVDCGKRAQAYDHRDYEKPLDVVPVCISCNKKRGPGLNPGLKTFHEKHIK